MFTALLTPFGTFYLSSVNPQSWSILGVGFSWLFIDAAIFNAPNSRKQIFLLIVAGVLIGLAWISRRDSQLYVVYTSCLVTLIRLSHRLRRRSKFVIAGVPIFGLGLGIGLAIANPLGIVNHAESLFRYERTQPDNTVFISHYIIDGISKWLEAFRTVPTFSSVHVHSLASVISQAVAIAVVLVSIVSRSHRSRIALSATYLFSVIILMAHSSQTDDRGPFGPSVHYVYSLVLFGIGLGFLVSNSNIELFFARWGCVIAVASVVSFGFVSFAVAERYVDRQTFGVRWIPEGPDQWWWGGMPIGPNSVVFAGILLMSAAMWKLNQFTTAYTDETTTQEQ
jgi:hypothetical protein